MGITLSDTLAELNSSQGLTNPPSGLTPPPETPDQPTATPDGAQDQAHSLGFGIADGLSFGFFDELSAALETLRPGAPLPGRQTVWTSNKSWGDEYANNLAIERATAKRAFEDNPWTYRAGEFGSALAIPFGSGAKGALQVAKVGAIQGALFGAGSADGDITDRLRSAAEGTIAGGLLGGALGKVGPMVGRGIAKLLGRGEQAVEEIAPKVEGWADSAATDTREPVIDPPSLPDESPIELKAPSATGEGEETVGSISRAGLKELGSQVDAFKARIEGGGDRSADITRELDPEAAKSVGEFRLGNLGDGPEAAGLIAALARALPSKGVKSDVELMATARAAANEIGEDPEAVLAAGQSIAGGLGDADTAMATMRVLWGRASNDISKIHLGGVDWDTASDQLVGDTAIKIRNMLQLSQFVQQAKVGLGRALRVNSLADPDSYLKGIADGVEAQAAPRSIPPLPTTRDQMKQWFDLWGMTGGDPQKQAEFLQGLLTVPTPGKYVRTSMANFFTASILSAPRTVALNVIGPGFLSVVRNVERMSGAAIRGISPFLSAEERQAARIVAKQTPIAYFQTIGGIADAFKQAVKASEINHTIIGGGGQTFDPGRTFGPITENLLEYAGEQPSSLYTLGNLINVWPKAFARLNNGLDEFSKRLAYQGEVRVRAMVEAAQNGLDGEEFTRFVHDKMLTSYDEIGRAADADLLRSAERTTLTGQIGEEGTKLRQLGSLVSTWRQDIPELRYVLPVMNVPANALGETLRRLPIAGMPVFNKLFERTTAELAGDYGPVAAAEAHGRHMLGTSFLIAAYMLNRAGLLTGAGPQDPTDRKVWLTEHQPYSMRVGDDWVRYDKFDILGGLLSIPATLHDATTYSRLDKGEGDMWLSAVGALGQWFKDRASIRTAADFLNLGDNPTQNIGRYAEKFVGQVAAGFFPAALRTTTTEVLDPVSHLKNGWMDYVKAALPGLSQTLEPMRNVLGEVINRPNNTIGEAFFPVTISPAVTFKDDPTVDELDRLYQATGYGAGADPKALGYGYFDPREVKLEDGKSLFDHAMKARQEYKIGGLTLRQALGRLFNSDGYNRAVDADPGQKRTSLGDTSRAYLVKQLFQAYNEGIKGDLAASSPIASKWLTAAAAKLTDDAYLRDVSAKDLVDNPELYATHRINGAGYTQKIIAKGGSAQALLEALPQ